MVVQRGRTQTRIGTGEWSGAETEGLPQPIAVARHAEGTATAGEFAGKCGERWRGTRDGTGT